MYNPSLRHISSCHSLLTGNRNLISVPIRIGFLVSVSRIQLERESFPSLSLRFQIQKCPNRIFRIDNVPVQFQYLLMCIVRVWMLYYDLAQGQKMTVFYQHIHICNFLLYLYVSFFKHILYA